MRNFWFWVLIKGSLPVAKPLSTVEEPHACGKQAGNRVFWWPFNCELLPATGAGFQWNGECLPTDAGTGQVPPTIALSCSSSVGQRIAMWICDANDSELQRRWCNHLELDGKIETKAKAAAPGASAGAAVTVTAGGLGALTGAL